MSDMLQLVVDYLLWPLVFKYNVDKYESSFVLRLTSKPHDKLKFIGH